MTINVDFAKCLVRALWNCGPLGFALQIPDLATFAVGSGVVAGPHSRSNDISGGERGLGRVWGGVEEGLEQAWGGGFAGLNVGKIAKR